MVTEISAKKILTYHSDPFPTHWDVNPYRGCTIGCSYCFAQYTHRYLEADSFFRDIFVKTNADICLKKEFSNKKWQKEQIKIGGTTDLYQHLEEKYVLVPKLLKTAQQFRNPVFLQTKSTLILRDFELISELSKTTDVTIATSVSMTNEMLRKVIEPGAASTAERIEMLGKFKGHCRSTILGIMPIIPYISDDYENLETIFQLAQQNQVDFVVTSFLFLRGQVKTDFFRLIQKNFPEIYPKFIAVYHSDYPAENYLSEKKKMIAMLKEKYGFTKTYQPPQLKPQTLQTSLF